MGTENNKTVIDIQKIKKTEIKDEMLGVDVFDVIISSMKIPAVFSLPLAVGFLLFSYKSALLK